MTPDRRTVTYQILLGFYLTNLSSLWNQTAAQVWERLHHQIFSAPAFEMVAISEESGQHLRIFFQRGYQFRIQLDTIEFFCDGSTIWLYQPRHHQVIVTEFKQELLPVEILMLLDHTRRAYHLELSKIISSSKSPPLQWLLTLHYPDSSAITFQRAELGFDMQWQLRQITLIMPTGHQRQWIIERLRPLSVPLPRDFFQPSLPDSIRVLDLRPQ